MLKVAITGNMGSGKTTVANVFQCLGIPVYFADLESKKMLLNPDVIASLRLLFGEGIMFDKYIVDKQKLSQIVFNDPHALNKLNNLMHPLVASHFEQWYNWHSSEPYVIQEAAILFESGWDKMFDKIITVTAPSSLLISRASKRDRLGEKHVEERLKNQWSQEKKAFLSDYVIENDESRLLIPQILEIHNSLLKQSGLV